MQRIPSRNQSMWLDSEFHLKTLQSTPAAYGWRKVLTKRDYSTGKLYTNSDERWKTPLNKLIFIFSYVRKVDPKTGEVGCEYEKPPLNLPREQFTPCPVKAGSLVLLHGAVVHLNDQNLSDKRRSTFVLYLIETDNCKYLEENWNKLPKDEQFERLYSHL